MCNRLSIKASFIKLSFLSLRENIFSEKIIKIMELYENL